MNGNINVTAQFDRKYYTVTAVRKSTGGRITPSGTIKIKPGQTKTLAIKANRGFSISDVLVDGNSVGPVTAYPFTDISSDHIIEVTFVRM